MKELRSFIFLLGLGLFCQSTAFAQVGVSNLKTEYLETPLGIDAEHPRFSWQMIAPEREHGFKQVAYHIIVSDASGNAVWDSDRIESDVSLGVTYDGRPLQPVTRYSWNLTIWDQMGNEAKNTSWFETGLMDPDLSAWNGATWIGGSEEDMVFYSQYLSVYRIHYTLQLDQASNSTHAGFVFGANDSRLMERDKNILGIESTENESYIAFELDISAVDGSEEGLASLNIYRVGYHPEDSAEMPFKQYEVPSSLINIINKYDPHEIIAESNFGIFMIYIGGREDHNRIIISDNPSPFGPQGLNLNPVGSGNNYISYPMVADIGFWMKPDQIAKFSAVEIRNFREPENALFLEELQNTSSYQGIFAPFLNEGLIIEDGAFKLEGGTAGSLLIADPSRNAMPMLRSEFQVEDKPISKARLYATARGIYTLSLNGKGVSDDYFSPGLTQYNITHLYQTYDVTSLLESGEQNAIGAKLGEGWWSGNITFSGENWNFFGDRQSLLAQLHITYDDGSSDIIVTSPDTWKYYNEGPLRYGSFFQGEVYDARLEPEIAGWDRAGFEDSDWKQSVVVPLEGTTYQNENLNYEQLALIGQYDHSARKVLSLTAESVEEVRPGVFVYDMGQNMVGVPEISIENGSPGQTITMRYAEVKYPDLDEHGDNTGMIMLENIRAALTQDIYILRGGNETIAPEFTFHGYRYLEITGIDEALPLDAVKGSVISSIPDLTASYETSNEKVNRLWKNITWSMRGNFLSIPTDTPARNERMGWGGDISVFSRASTYLADAGPFLRKHMLAIRDMQRNDGRFPDVAPVGGGFGGILWGSAGITVAWEAYLQYGDKDMLAEHYDAMKKYITYLETRIDSATGILNEGPLGDWLSPENGQNDNTLLWSAYFVYDLEIMANVAEILGKHDEAASYHEKYTSRKTHFNETHVHPISGKTIGTGFPLRSFGGGQPPEAGSLIDTQASYAVPLALGVFNEENKKMAIEHLAEAVRRSNEDDAGIERPAYSLMTGFIGTAWISNALSENGYHEEAYRLLQQTSYPSWLYPIDQGATTIWERLNSYTVEDGFGGNNSMNSFNHYSFGAVGAWMYNYSLGIEREKGYPGFKQFILQPTPDPDGAMTWARGHYDSMYGRIESGWQIDGDAVIYDFTVPANTIATLHLPALESDEVMESGRPALESDGVSFIRFEGDRSVYELTSGTYRFTVSN